MEQVDALLAGVYARAAEVQGAVDPEAMLRELLAPLHVLLAQQLAGQSLRKDTESDDTSPKEPQADAPPAAASSAKPPHGYLSEAATRIQALMLGGTRTTAARSDTSSSSNDGNATTSSSKSVIEPEKSKPQSYFSGAASRLQALVRGHAGSDAARTNSASLIASPVKRNSKPPSQKMPLGLAATRIQALVRGKTERDSVIRQKSFLVQGTKVSGMQYLSSMVVLICVLNLVDIVQVLRKYVLKSDRFPNCHVLDTPDGDIGSLRTDIVNDVNFPISSKLQAAGRNPIVWLRSAFSGMWRLESFNFQAIRVRTDRLCMLCCRSGDASAQIQEGIQMILNRVAADGFSKVVWINLREVSDSPHWYLIALLTMMCSHYNCSFSRHQEPVIYVEGRPYTARRTAKLNENDTVPGITGHKAQILETSMKNNLQEQLRNAHHKLEYWHEVDLYQNELLSVTVDPEQVFTLPELYELDAVTKANSAIEWVKYYRIPIERENAPEHADVELIMNLIRSATPIVNSATSDTAFIFNCQMGKRRTTTALVLSSLIWQRPRVDINDFPVAERTEDERRSSVAEPRSTEYGNFAVIREVQRQLPFGFQAKTWVDKAIDECAAICNIRSVINEYHEKSMAEAKPAKRSYYLHHALSFLERYFYIVVFGAYMLSTKASQRTAIEGQDGEGEALTPASTEGEESAVALQSFSKWLQTHPNLFRLLDDLGGVRYHSDKVLQDCVIKEDHFFGIARIPHVLTSGVPNFRRVGNEPIFGTAQCLESGLRDVVNHLRGEFDRAIWINLREEAVIYVSGKPFVMRHPDNIMENVEYPGIEADEINAIEVQVKEEIKTEVRKANGLLMYWYEPRVMYSEEMMDHVNPEVEIKTLTEIYDEVTAETKFDLHYARIPVSDETAPEEKDLDDLVRLLAPVFLQELGLEVGQTNEDQPGQLAVSAAKSPNKPTTKTAVICNCQMGRGRTTTALVCTYMLRIVLEDCAAQQNAPSAEGKAPSMLEQICGTKHSHTLRRQSSAVNGEFVVIRKLLHTLDNGDDCKLLVDYAVNQCEHMQNLRECIAQCRDLAMENDLTSAKRDHFMLRAVNYLERYFYLICFASYLLEERARGFQGTIFVKWMSERYGSALYALLDNLCFEEDVGAETHVSSMRWRWRRKRKLVSRLEMMPRDANATDVLSVQGTVKRAYPLRELLTHGAGTVGGACGAFTLGDGPCGPDAARVLTIVLENARTFESCVLFLYDQWADKMRFLQRHYKVRIQGRGLVMAPYWDGGGDSLDDTEDQQLPCYIVAERYLLKKALERYPNARNFPSALPRGISIDITYGEPLRVGESDQLRYLPSVTIYARDLYRDKGKRTLQKATGDYTYTCLGDLIPGKADLYGVVVNFSLPKRTRGTDYSMTVNIVDESCPRREGAIQVMVFQSSLEKMPRLLFTRYLVIRDKEDDPNELEQLTCSESWTFDATDEVRARELLNWSKQSLCADTTFCPGYPHPPTLLSEIVSIGCYVDVVIKVLFIDRSRGDHNVRLIVWDGSGDGDAPRNNAAAQLIAKHSIALPAPQGVLKQIVFDSCWGLLRDMGFADRLLNHWCRFRNLPVEEKQQRDEGDPSTDGDDDVELRFREGSSLVFVPEGMRDVQDRLALVNPSPTETASDEDYANESVILDKPVEKVWTIIPEQIRGKVPVTSLEDVRRSDVVPRKYLCLAHVVKIWPEDITKITKVAQKQQPQSGSASSEYIYSFVLRLQDADSCTLDVIVYSSDAGADLLVPHGFPPLGAFFARHPTLRPHDEHEFTDRAFQALCRTTEEPAAAALVYQSVHTCHVVEKLRLFGLSHECDSLSFV
ncbi:Iq motif, ef-hand binding site, partial [Globisporangium splendens]